MTQEEAQARVARGAALLDESRPGWAELIDAGKLNMASNCMCILGQLEGSFLNCVRAYCGDAGPDCYGFNVLSSPDMYDEYRVLDGAWREAIADRLVPPATWTHRERTRVTSS